MNEMYAKDISKKIKSTFKSKGKSGKHVASVTPYGYLKDENDGNHWIVDEEAAEIVRLFYQYPSSHILFSFYELTRPYPYVRNHSLSSSYWNISSTLAPHTFAILSARVTDGL